MPEGRRRPATMADVAREVGLSHQTVSRVLNDHPLVRPETRERVRKAIEDLGYRPNSAARALVTRRSQTLGVITFNSTLYGPASTLFGIEQAARDAGFVVSIDSLTALTATSVRAALDRLAKQAVEGIIVIAPLSGTAEVLSALAGQLPAVVVEGGAVPGLGAVSVDQEAGARRVTRHLLDQGAATVWHVAGPGDWVEAEGRVLGWRRVLREAGAAVHRPLRGTWSPSSGYQAGRRLADRGDVEAVFVANDQMALGLLRAFHEAGVRVPGDVLVAGFDDVPEAAYFTPPLTTVRQDFTAVGRRSIELLVEQVAAGRPLERRAVVPVELVVRQSSTR
ncbi:transcriptional regulator, LacI family [Asanoa ishikariensis]|uniref:Transcriptional regulator, LacI family n=1 Tax=Asanoa ishikariensis TaxID=137265 RepID=A0A1H3TKI9_9ACTN|nr:LacI family DNA-binding transcriptional regulator [Asanoa ishikariensis]SDZ50321.1 transcriptional regulator, LacI family [Asanoa ishikariensis]